MGNALGRSKRRTTRVMKINGETTKHRTPIQAMQITRDNPGHVVLDSEAVKHLGVRAKPLGPAEFLQPKRLYFLVELPKLPAESHRAPRRVRSGGIQVSAKDRLESLMLSKRSVSDLSTMRVPAAGEGESPMRVRMRLPKAEVERLMRQSKDGAEAAQRIMSLCFNDKETLSLESVQTEMGKQKSILNYYEGQETRRHYPQPSYEYAFCQQH